VRAAPVLVAAVALLAPPGAGTSAVARHIGTPTTVSPSNSRLWTHHPRDAYVASGDEVKPNGAIEYKSPWFAAGPRGRSKRGPRGVLHITGTRLDQLAGTARATTTQVCVEGFGGSGVWAAVITFPSEGCWAVKGRVQRTVHRFRIVLMKA
jgi:hypothetical protein